MRPFCLRYVAVQCFIGFFTATGLANAVPEFRAAAMKADFVGYTNGYHGYFPTIRAAVEGGYGAEGIVARVEVGAGEAMVDMAIVRLLTMQGLLKSVP